MNKLVSLLLLFLFINGLFVTAVNPVSASGLVENSWNTKTSMNQARAGLGVVVVDDKIYAIGGSGGANECYNPKMDKWVTLTSMPTPKANFAIVAYQGKIYCISDELVSVTEVYDIASNSWSTKASMPHSRGGGLLQAHVIEEQIFVINVSNFRLFMYDPKTDSWTEKPSIPVDIATSAYSLVSTLVDDKIIVIGSFFVGESFNLTMENKVVDYDPKTDTWLEVYSASTTDETFFYDAAIGVTTGLYAPKRIYIFQEARTTVYDPIKNTWTTAEPMPTPRRQNGVAVIDDILYVIGGYTTRMELCPDISPLPIIRTDESAVNEQYIPLGYGTFSDNSKPYVNYLIVATLAITISVVVVSVVYVVFRKKTAKGKMETEKLSTNEATNNTH